MDEYYRAIRLLPAWLAQPLARLPQNTAEKVHELRLRTGCGICLSIAGQQTTLDELPECPQTLRGRTLDALQMDEILYVLCGGSVHTHQAELAQGYLTTASGCRVGVGGRFVLRGPEDVVLQRLLSLNFRIARPIVRNFRRSCALFCRDISSGHCWWENRTAARPPFCGKSPGNWLHRNGPWL